MKTRQHSIWKLADSLRSDTAYQQAEKLVETMREVARHEIEARNRAPEPCLDSTPTPVLKILGDLRSEKQNLQADLERWKGAWDAQQTMAEVLRKEVRNLNERLAAQETELESLRMKLLHAQVSEGGRPQ